MSTKPGFERLVPGLRATRSFTVTQERTASRAGNAGVHVQSTPNLIGELEQTCMEAVKDALPPGSITVGARVDVRHLAGSPVGFTVTCEAELVQVDGRRLEFRVSAHDGIDLAMEGVHERFVLDAARAVEKNREKAAKRPGG